MTWLQDASDDAIRQIAHSNLVVIFVRQTRKNVFARNPTYKPYVISRKSGLTQYHAQIARPKKKNADTA